MHPAARSSCAPLPRAFLPRALLPLLCLAAAARAQSTWIGGDSVNWTDSANWDSLPAGGPLVFNGPGLFAPLNNDFPSLSAGGLLFTNPLSAPITLGGLPVTLTGGVTNLNTTAARDVTVGNGLVIANNQVWSTAADVDAVVRVTGALSGSGNITLGTAAGSNNTSLPVFRLAGANAGYTGTLTPGTDSGFLMEAPPAQTSGVVDLNGNNRNLWLSANTATNAYTFWTGNTTPASGEPMRVNFRNAGTSGLYLAGGDVHWNPVSDGNHYVWDAARAGTNGEIRFNGSNDTAAAPAIATPRLWHFGNNNGSLVLGGARTLRAGGGGSNSGRVRLNFALSDDGTARGLTLGAGLLILTRDAGGGPFTPSLQGSVSLATGATSVSDMDQLFNGWLQMNGGVLVLDNLSWSGFMADRSAGYRASAGVADTWGITNGGSGFAARGQDLEIMINPDPGASYGTINAGSVFNRDFTIGATVRDADKTLYANRPVRIAQPTVLTAARIIRVAGGNLERTTAWTIESPVHEFSGPITGAFPLTIGGTGAQAGGTLRLSNTNNTFSALNVNPAGQAGGVIVLATDDAALGTGTVTVGTGTQGQAGLLLLENPGAGVRTFNRNLTVALGVDASGGDSGVGSWAGDVSYGGIVTITGNRATMPFHVESGSFAFAPGGGFQNDSTGGVFTYAKGGAGVVDLRSFTPSGTKADWRWVLYQGGVVSSSSSRMVGGAAAFRAADMIGYNPIYNGAPNLPKLWRVTGSDHLFTGVDATGGWAPNATVDVEAGRVLSLDFGANGFAPTESFGQNVSTPAWKVVKTGGGTWTMNNSRTAIGFGPVNGAAFIEVAQGTLDLSGDYGRGSVRLLNGATLLSGSFSPFTYATGAGFQLGISQIGLMEIQGTGGRIGISPAASASVSRAAGIAWSQQPGARLTLSARDNLNLIFSGAVFPDVDPGSELRVTRDGSGAGLVRISDLALAVNGTLSGTGALQLGAANNGVVTVNGAVAPGADGPGILSTGNLTLGVTGALALDINGSAPGSGHDRLDVTGALILAAGAQLDVSFGFGPATGAVFTVVNNDDTDAVSGLFSDGANELSEGETFAAGAVTCTISYTGGDGNDVTLTVASSSPTGYNVWIGGFGLAPGDRDETDDPDGDGMNNLLEYFAALDPNQSSAPMSTALDATATTLRFTFRRSKTIPDLGYQLQWSPDLTNWFPANGTHTFAETVIGGDTAHDLVRATLTYPASAQRLYARVAVTRTP